MSMPLPSERPSFSAPQSSVIGRSPCWLSQHCSPHHRGSSMSLPLPSEHLSSLSLRGMSSSSLQGIERSSKNHVMVSAHARLWALSKIHSVVSPHIESSAFFLKSRLLRKIGLPSPPHGEVGITFPVATPRGRSSKFP